MHAGQTRVQTVTTFDLTLRAAGAGAPAPRRYRENMPLPTLLLFLVVTPARHVEPAVDVANAHGAKIALYYSGWQLVGQREDQPTAGDVNNVTRAKELLARGFTHGMLSHGNDATISDDGTVAYGSNCSGWTPTSRTCAARFLFANGLASYMTVGLNFHRFYEDPGSIPMALRRQYSPFVNRTHHMLAMEKMTDNLRALSPWLGGIANDLEYGCWPPNLGIGNETAEQFKFPDLPERLGNARSAMDDMGYLSFTNWPTAKAHPRPQDADWTLEQLMYNMPTQSLYSVPKSWDDVELVRVSGSPDGNTTMFAQIFVPATTQRLTRVDLWLRLSATTALPQMPYISYFIAPLKGDGSPDVDNPIQCAIPRPNKRRGGKWIKCGIGAKELPVVPPTPDRGSWMDQWQPMKLYFNPEEAVLQRGKQYALVLESCPLDKCWLSGRSEHHVNSASSGLDTVDYEIALHRSNTPTLGRAMTFARGSWQPLPDTTAITAMYVPGSTAHGYSPNQLHADWVAFHANITANEVKQMSVIAQTIPARHIVDGKTKPLDVVVYSGYAGLGVYDPSSIDHYGDLAEKYGVDWEVLSAAGLNVAMVGYGDHDITPMISKIAKGKKASVGKKGSCPVVCGVISGTQAQFAQRYNTCAAAQGGDGYIMEYDGHHTFDNDLGFHVPSLLGDNNLNLKSDDDVKFLSKSDRSSPMSSTAAAVNNNRTVMAWFYEMASNEEYVNTFQWMQKVNQNRVTFNAISDGSLYHVYPNATIVRHPKNIERHAMWKKAGYKVYPCVAGLELDTMRLLFDRENHRIGDAFIDVLVKDAVEHNYDGINVDFEAYGNLTDSSYPPLLQDGVDYAAFLSRFAGKARQNGVALSVDTDTPAGECESRAQGTTNRNHGQPCPWYTRLYNWDSLAVSNIDRVISMSTYTWGDTSFMNHILWMTWFIKPENTGIGLCPSCLVHAKVTPARSELQYRFDIISKFGFNEIDVWMVGPDPKLLAAFDLWNPYFADFLETTDAATS